MTKDQFVNLIRSFSEDIILFVNKAILEPYNHATGDNFFITRQQKEMLIAFQKLVNDKIKGERQDIIGVSVMSGRGTGKDAVTSWIILWFMTCFKKPKIPCISVSSDQLDKVLWSEISKWNSHFLLKSMFALQADKFYCIDVPDAERGKEWFAFKKAANPRSSFEEQVETLQGLHADYMLTIVDEGSGVLDSVYHALENNQTAGKCNLMLVIFNPMHAKGYAIDTQDKHSDRWITFRWDSEDSEITNKDNIKRIKEDYGVDSNIWRMNVKGLPPLFDETNLFPWDWVINAVGKEIELPSGLPLVKAVDCGAGGDKSIIATRRGNKIYPFKRNNTADSTELVNWIGVDVDLEHPDVIRVDVAGIGWAVEGTLRDKKGSIVEAADSRRSPDNGDMFINKRAEMYWNLRECFEKGTISIPDDPPLLEQLSVIKYEITKDGKIQINDKKKIKKEIGHSPDELDALAMLYYFKDSMISKKITMMTNLHVRNGRTFMAA